MAGPTGGEAAGTIGRSLLGYFAGRKGRKRQDEIALEAARLADPFASQRGYYQGILGSLYGMPTASTEAPAESGGKEGKSRLETGLLGGLLMGPMGASIGGLFGGSGPGGLLNNLLSPGEGNLAVDRTGISGLLGGLLG